MSYSAVDPSSIPNNKIISTRMAYSDNGGAAWSDDGVVNEGMDTPLPAPANRGTWDHEVSRVVYDADAPAGERWILLWHRVLVVDGTRLFEHSWIGTRSSGTAAPGNWSAERKLMVGSYYLASDDGIVGPPEVRLPDLHADLADCGVPTEPGALATATALYVSLYCASANAALGRQVLVRRVRATGAWEYVGTFSTNLDAQAAGYDDFSGTDLIQEGNRRFLVVSPESALRYKGCVLFQIAELSTATLVRAGNPPRPVPTRSLQLALGGTGFGGACGYHSTSQTGFIYSELFQDSPPFRIFSTFVRP